MKTRKMIIVLISVILIISISIKVKAETNDSYIISMSSNNTTVKQGQTVTISLKVEDINIQSGEKGIGSYEGTIEYDKSVFETVKMSGNEEWDTPVLNEGRFTSVKTDGIVTNKSQEIGKITLKVKENAKIGSTKIEIKEFEASNGVENIATRNAEISIKVEETEKKENNISGNNNVNGNTSSGTKNNIKENTTAKNKIPKAGARREVQIFTVVAIIVGICSYVMYKRTY